MHKSEIYNFIVAVREYEFCKAFLAGTITKERFREDFNDFFRKGSKKIKFRDRIKRLITRGKPDAKKPQQSGFNDDALDYVIYFFLSQKLMNGQTHPARPDLNMDKVVRIITNTRFDPNHPLIWCDNKRFYHAFEIYWALEYMIQYAPKNPLLAMFWEEQDKPEFVIRIIEGAIKAWLGDEIEINIRVYIDDFFYYSKGKKLKNATEDLNARLESIAQRFSEYVRQSHLASSKFPEIAKLRQLGGFELVFPHPDGNAVDNREWKNLKYSQSIDNDIYIGLYSLVKLTEGQKHIDSQIPCEAVAWTLRSGTTRAIASRNDDHEMGRLYYVISRKEGYGKGAGKQGRHEYEGSRGPGWNCYVFHADSIIIAHIVHYFWNNPKRLPAFIHALFDGVFPHYDSSGQNYNVAKLLNEDEKIYHNITNGKMIFCDAGYFSAELFPISDRGSWLYLEQYQELLKPLIEERRVRYIVYKL